jgi:hypothetical protein
MAELGYLELSSPAFPYRLERNLAWKTPAHQRDSQLCCAQPFFGFGGLFFAPRATFAQVPFAGTA